MVFLLKDEDRKWLDESQALLQSAQAEQKLHTLIGTDINGIVISLVEKHLFARRKGSYRDVPLTYTHWLLDARGVAETAIQNLTSLATREVRSLPLDTEIEIPESSFKQPTDHPFALRTDDNGYFVVIKRKAKKWLDKSVTGFLKYYFCAPIDVNHWPGPEMDRIKKRRKETQERERQVLHAMEKKLHM